MNTTIFDLCDDCVREIVRFLDFKDFVSLDRASEKFENVVRLALNAEYSLDMNTSLKFTPIFLEKYNPKIRSMFLIDFYGNSKQYARYIKSIIPLVNKSHLKELKVEVYGPLINELIRSMSNVHEPNMVEHLSVHRLTYLQFFIKAEKKRIEEFLNIFSRVSRLEFETCFLDFEQINLLRFTNLKRLIFVNCSIDSSDMNLFESITKSIALNLTEFMMGLRDLKSNCTATKRLVDVVVEAAPNLVVIGLKIKFFESGVIHA